MSKNVWSAIRKTVVQAARFSVVGVANVFINALVYVGLVYIGVHYIAASFVGYVLGIINAFFWSKRFVFRVDGAAFEQFLKTILVYLVQLLVSWTGLIAFVEIFGFNPYIAYAANAIVVTLLSFFGLKLFVFRKQRDANSDNGRP